MVFAHVVDAQVGEGRSGVSSCVASKGPQHSRVGRCCSGGRELSVEQATSLRPNRPIEDGWNYGNALVGEFMVAFWLAFTVLRTSVTGGTDFDYSTMACFAIGLDVFLGRSLLIPIDGHSIYPTRSFGPAVVAWTTGSRKGTFQDMWISGRWVCSACSCLLSTPSTITRQSQGSMSRGNSSLSESCRSTCS